MTDDVKEPYLLVECPRQLFPFARRIIYDMHSDGGLPPLMLDPVNFADLYEKRKKQIEAGKKSQHAPGKIQKSGR